MKPSEKTKCAERAIVFGGSGFLGSHVSDILSGAAYQVKIFDLRPSSYLRPGQEMIVGDILDNAKVREAVRGCDYVYNFAGIADLDDATTKPLDTVKLNIVGNTNIMDACVQTKAKRFIYASSIYVYSERGGFYRCSKQASELYIEEYQRRFGLDFTILRFSTLYGPRADARNSVYRYLKQALTEGRIECPSSGEEIRDYVHVRDAARLSADILKEEFRNKHVIISGPQSVKFRDMLNMINEILGGKIDITYRNQRNSAHYEYAPYSFAPKIGYKLTNHMYLDVGQGLLECLHEIHEKFLERERNECTRKTTDSPVRGIGTE